MLDQPDAQNYADWPEDRRAEIAQNWTNRKVGTELVSETAAVRVWHLVLNPGERAPFHRHDESYFWTCVTPGRSRSYYHDGAMKEMDYNAGDTRHFDITNDEFFVHDLENIGDTPLKFVTVEFKSPR